MFSTRHVIRFPRLLIGAAVLAGSVCWTAGAETFDLIIGGAEIVDGAGTPAYTADVGIRNGFIAAIGDLADDESDERIDAAGLTLTPGFIDFHSHADGPSAAKGLRSFNPRRRAAPNQVAQGVTTVVVNQDGRSPLNIARQRTELGRRGIGPNAILMVGHNTVRRAVMEKDHERAATEDEIETMAALVREGMAAGAFGMTAGLEYVPGIWSTTEELIALVQELTPFGGVYIAHERSSGLDPMWYVPSQHGSGQPTMLDSIDETIAIGRATGATVVATHIKARGVPYWGGSAAIVERIRQARDEGVRVYADNYTYTSSGSDGTITLLPYWVLDRFDGAGTDYIGALKDAAARPETAIVLAKDVQHEIDRRGGAANIVVFDFPDRRFIGRSLAEIAARYELSATEMALEFQYRGYPKLFGGARIRGFSMSEEDVRRFTAQPWVATGSDAGIVLPNDQLVHPRNYGTFPRKLRRYAIDDDVLSVPDAIRSMTSLPAEILGIKNRGTIAVGNYADLVLIDLAAIRDTATYFAPHRYPEGIPFVFVNGVAAVENGILTWSLPGRVVTPELARTADPEDLRHTD